jgi:hypothetical protein
MESSFFVFPDAAPFSRCRPHQRKFQSFWKHVILPIHYLVYFSFFCQRQFLSTLLKGHVISRGQEMPTLVTLGGSTEITSKSLYIEYTLKLLSHLSSNLVRAHAQSTRMVWVLTSLWNALTPGSGETEPFVHTRCLCTTPRLHTHSAEEIRVPRLLGHPAFFLPSCLFIWLHSVSSCGLSWDPTRRTEQQQHRARRVCWRGDICYVFLCPEVSLGCQLIEVAGHCWVCLEKANHLIWPLCRECVCVCVCARAGMCA